MGSQASPANGKDNIKVCSGQLDAPAPDCLPARQPAWKYCYCYYLVYLASYEVRAGGLHSRYVWSRTSHLPRQFSGCAPACLPCVVVPATHPHAFTQSVSCCTSFTHHRLHRHHHHHHRRHHHYLLLLAVNCMCRHPAQPMVGTWHSSRATSQFSDDASTDCSLLSCPDASHSLRSVSAHSYSHTSLYTCWYTCWPCPACVVCIIINDQCSPAADSPAKLPDAQPRPPPSIRWKRSRGSSPAQSSRCLRLKTAS